MTALPLPPSPEASWPYAGALGRVMARITAADRQRIMDALAEGLIAELAIDLVRIWLYDPADDMLHLRARASRTGLEPDAVDRLHRRDLQAPIVRAIESRRPLVIDNIRPEDGIVGADALRREGLSAYAGFPLALADRVVGGLSLYRRAPFPPSLLDALGILTQQAALALEHARLLDESHALQAMATELASARDMRALLHGVVERAMAAFGAEGCGVWLLDEGTGALRPAAVRGLSSSYLAVYSGGTAAQSAPTFEELRRTRRPLYTPDARADARRRDPTWGEVFAAEGIVSALRLPLFAPGGDVQGLLALYHRRDRFYGDEEVRLAQAFADQIAVALRNVRMAEQERQAREEAARLAEEERAAREAAARQLDRLAALAGITERLLAATELDAVLNVVVESASRLCDASGALVGLIETDRPYLRPRAVHGALAGLFRLIERGERLDESYLSATAIGQAIGGGKAVVVEDYATWPAPPERRERALAVGVRAFIIAPLRVGGTPIGVLLVGDPTPRTFAPEDVALVQALADQMALAIEQARLLARSRDAAVLEERNRLARDLHDSVTQTIAGLGMLAQAAKVQHARGLPALGTTLDRVGTLAQEALAETRALLYELRPAALAEEGLAGALEKLIAAVQVRADIPITYDGATSGRLSPESELAIFRIVQEALNNAAKYARASAIAVTVTEADGRLGVTVADDGVGFDPAAPVPPSADAKRGGMGLRTMRERAAAAGLVLRVDSAIGAGTRVTVTAPLP